MNSQARACTSSCSARIALLSLAILGVACDKKPPGTRSEDATPASVELERRSVAPGSLILTNESSIFRFNAENETVENTWALPEEARYAVPINNARRFLLVVEGENPDGMILLVHAPGEDYKPRIHFKKIGRPVPSPDGSRAAWVAQSIDGTVSLNVAPISDLGKPVTTAGNFAIDNAGPSWYSEQDGRLSFIIAMSSGEISRIEWDPKRITTLTEGTLPVLLPKERTVLFYRDEKLWRYDLRTNAVELVIEVGYIHEYYRAYQASPDEKHVVFKTLVRRRLGNTRTTKELPSFLIIDLEGRTKKLLNIDDWAANGPWGWLN